MCLRGSRARCVHAIYKISCPAPAPHRWDQTMRRPMTRRVCLLDRRFPSTSFFFCTTHSSGSWMLGACVPTRSMTDTLRRLVQRLELIEPRPIVCECALPSRDVCDGSSHLHRPRTPRRSQLPVARSARIYMGPVRRKRAQLGFAE